MDDEDKDDIIKKVKTSGEGDDEESTDTSDGEMEDTGDEGATETGDETTDAGTGDETATDASANEPADDSENMFETEMIDEMSLGDWKAELIINMYDNGDKSLKSLLTRLISFEEMLGDEEKNRKRFLSDLREDHDNEDIIQIINDLKENGIDVSKFDLSESFFLTNPPKNNMFQEGSNDILDEKDDRCTRIAKRKYDVWPSAYASGAVVKCRQGKIWKDVSEAELDKLDMLEEKWSKKYKNNIDCNNPKGFSQKAYCQGKKNK
jgi:hypothetical protein